MTCPMSKFISASEKQRKSLLKNKRDSNFYGYGFRIHIHPLRCHQLLHRFQLSQEKSLQEKALEEESAFVVNAYLVHRGTSSLAVVSHQDYIYAKPRYQNAALEDQGLSLQFLGT